MTEKVIPAAAVEAAAKVMFEEVFAPNMRRALAAAEKSTTDDPEAVETPRRACAVTVWDGPYKMTCGHIIVRGKCVRHGANGATYEIRTGPNAR